MDLWNINFDSIETQDYNLNGFPKQSGSYIEMNTNQWQWNKLEKWRRKIALRAPKWFRANQPEFG